MKLPLSFESSTTGSELRRILPQAVGFLPFSDQGDCFVHHDGARSWRIGMTPLAVKTLGLISWRPMRIDFSFEGFAPEQIDAFMQRFELYFRRGGG